MTTEEFIESIGLPGETWKDIAGYEGLYMVSNKGRVLATRKKVYTGNGYGYKQPKIMSQNELVTKNCKYFTVMLYGRGRPRRVLVHRVEMEAFTPNPLSLPEIDHINRNGQDNRLENLRWCNRKMNMANENTKKVLSLCHDGHDGTYRWRPVLQMQHGCIIRKYDSLASTKEFGFNPNIVTQVCRGKKKSHLGYQWMYLSDYENKKE